MKPLKRILLWTVLVSWLLVLPVNAVQASSQSDSIPNSTTEDFVLKELRASGFVDLQDFPEEERVISGDFLVTALKDPEVQSKSLIFIANLKVAGEVIANDLILPGNLQFLNVEFTDYVDFNSSLLHALWISDSEFMDSADFSHGSFEGNMVISHNIFESLLFTRSRINGSMDLRGNTFNQGIDFYGTHITRELLLDDSQILGTEPMPGTSFTAIFWTTTVEGIASFFNTHFAGAANFAQANFFRLEMQGAIFDQEAVFSETIVSRSADFSNASFGQLANFKDFHVENIAKFNGATFNGEANFEDASVVRQADFSDAVFNAPAMFNYFTADRFMDFYRTTFNDKFSLYYSTIAWPYFENVVFNGPVNFQGMSASEDFELVDTTYNCSEPFSAYNVEVKGEVNFTRFSTKAGLVLSGGNFGSLGINTAKNPDIAFIDLTGTTIDGQFAVENVNTKSLLAEGATIGKSTTFNHVSITKTLDLRNASIGFLKVDDQLKWPNDSKAFNLRGMTYTDIDLGDQGLTEETWQRLLVLINQSAYSPQAYQALGQFLTDKGHPDWAAEVDLEQNRRERKEVLTPLSGAWFWSWFLEIFIGYGNRPALAFIWSGLVVAIGAFVFRRREDMLPVEQDDAKVEYNPIWYSFALFIPYVNLGIAEKWEPSPDKPWMRNYKYIHMMLGWILAPIALLTFGGIIG